MSATASPVPIQSQRKAAAIQALIIWGAIILNVYIAIPRLIGGIAYSRLSKAGACVGVDHSTLRIWQMLFTGKLDGCAITHNAAVLQAQTLILLVVLLLGLCWLSWIFLIDGSPVVIGDIPEIFGAIIMGLGMAILIFSVLLLAAVALFAYLFFWAFVIMVGITAVAASSGR